MKKRISQIEIYHTFSLNRKSGLLLASILWLCIFPGKTPFAQNSSEEFTAYLDERIPGWMKRYDVPGVTISLIHQGDIVWENAYGYADTEHGIQMTVDTVCRVESISKSVTARGIMRLVEMGMVELDTSISKYLNSWEFPETDFDVDNITIRHLLSHSSGIPLGTIGLEYNPEDEIPSVRESLKREVHMVQPSGKSFIYSNPGFNILEVLIEDVTGRPFSEFMTDEILSPLEMITASYEWRADFHTPVPKGYNIRGVPVPNYVYSEKAAGGLFASSRDIARFVAAGMLNGFYSGENILSQSSIRELYTPVIKVADIYALVSEYYGLGHFLETLPNGQRAVFSGGHGNGWMTHFHMIPETGEGIVIIMNSSRSWPLISHILSDWAKWNGYDSVGMGLIKKAITGLWILVSLIMAVSLLQLIRVIKESLKLKRRFDLDIKNYSGLQFMQLALSVILILILIWSLTRDYLIIAFVFPGVSGWLMAVLSFAAFTLFVSGILKNNHNYE